MKLKLITLALFLLGLAAVPAVHGQNTIGYISFDVTGPGLAQFDITNFTGVNSFLSPDANPVTDSVNLDSLSLTVNFLGGGSTVFGPSYFTLNADGISEDGTEEAFAGPISSAVLTGDFSETTMGLSDGTTADVEPGFTATITDLTGLVDGDNALIVTTPASVTTTVTPEPESFVLLGTGMAAIAALRRRKLLAALRARLLSLSGCGVAIAAAAFCLLVPAAHSQVKLAVDAVPSSGVAGFNSSTVTGAGFPKTTTLGDVTVAFANTCNGTALATTAATNYSSAGPTSDRVAFGIPATLATGTYFVSVSGASPAYTTNSSFCSAIQVTATSTTLAACVPTSSLAVTVGTNVTAYVPYGSWDDSEFPGLASVPLEGAGTAMNFTTTGFVNSCASNSTTGEVVCTENNTNVDLINGPTLTTVTSGATTFASFTGGSCQNCGVAINPTNNTAIIAEGVAGGGFNEGVQVLNLANNTFLAPFAMTNAVSEDISIDPTRNLVLSPGEDSNYTLLKIGAGNTFTEYGNPIGGGDLDSAAEDCTTQIALSSDEFTDQIYITDLSQATFTAGTPGTWTAPGQFVSLNDADYSAGTSGISSAPGSGHLAVVTGEFGGQAYSALKLPSTSGSGVPNLVDHAYVGSMPLDPSGLTFRAGFDPHTITAYTSPNTGKAYAVMADYAEGSDYPSYLAVVDLACVLSQPRNGDGITVTGTAAACTRYVAVPAPL